MNKHEPLPELTLNNLLDEDLIKVYDIATLFTNPQGRSVQLTEYQKSLLNKIISKKDEKNEYEDLFGENSTMIAMELQQLKQVSGIMKIMEIARTTENPEVLKAIMEQECFELNINILLEISKNPEADSEKPEKSRIL